MKITGQYSLLFMLTAVLAGCSSISTLPVTTLSKEGISPSQLEEGNPFYTNGLFYYLPVGRVHVVGAPSKDGSGYGITITPDITTDPRHLYYAKPDRNYMYEDLTDLKIDANGLLNSGKSTSTDQTAQIIGAIAGMIPKVNGATPALSPFDVTFYPDEDPNPSSTDKNGSGSLFAANKFMPDGFSLTCVAFAEPQDLPKNLPEKSIDHRVGGLVFRLPRAYQITVTNLANHITAQQIVILPDSRKNYVLDFSRMPFVAKVTNASFTSGMLTEVSQDVPSPVLGVLSIPKAIIQAVIPLPTPTASASQGNGSTSGSKTASK